MRGAGWGICDGEILLEEIEDETIGVKERGYIERSESYLLQISSDIGTHNNKTSDRWWRTLSVLHTVI